NTEINWSEYFEDMIGVTKPEGEVIENVVLHFFRKTGKYIQTKPLHGSQRDNWINMNTLEVRLEVIPNYELERLILSYAESVKVISTESLKMKILERHKKACLQY